MDAFVVKIMCPIPVKLLNNFGFKNGFHGKIWFYLGFSTLWFGFSTFKKPGNTDNLYEIMGDPLSIAKIF
jgi:hypothetical protein